MATIRKGFLRSFRHNISVLKKQGLIKNVDARSAMPGWKREGKRLDTLVKKYDDVISNKLTAVKVPSKSLKELKKAGFQVEKGRVMVPHAATETVSVEKGKIVYNHPSGITRVVIPCEYHNLRQYLECLKKNASKLNKLKKENEWFGARIHGGYTNLYRTIEMFIEAIEHYRSFEQGKRNRAKGVELYHHLEIVRVSNRAANSAWKYPGERTRRKRTKTENRKRRRADRERLQDQPSKLAEQRRKNTARNKLYRQRLKRSSKKWNEYKKEGRKRAAKSKRKS